VDIAFWIVTEIALVFRWINVAWAFRSRELEQWSARAGCRRDGESRCAREAASGAV